MGIETGALLAYSALASAAVGAGTAAYQGRQQELAQRAASDSADAARQQQREQLDLARQEMDSAAARERENKAKNPIAALFGASQGGALAGPSLPQVDLASLLGGGVQLPGLGFALGRNRLLGQ